MFHLYFCLHYLLSIFFPQPFHGCPSCLVPYALLHRHLAFVTTFLSPVASEH